MHDHFFLASFLTCLLICIGCAWDLVQGQVQVCGCLPIKWFFFFIDFKIFFHCVTHSIGPPSPLSTQFVILHLWSTFGCHGDPLFSLHPWWGKDGFQWSCARCLCIYHKRCGISCFTWADPHSHVASFLIFMSVGRHCDFDEWCLEVG